MKKIIKYHRLVLLLITFTLVAILSNPSEREYLEMTGESFYETLPDGLEVEIERVNFFLFSTYTPIVGNEYGITHLGVYGSFFQISDGQFDYPGWLELFN
ncbi:hypothetical protein [Bacillus sp. RO1]|uniref:hypothetical protein n=1 Tax=Bacillus sp. RO1 TaxID=2722703 RepID=UPI0014572FD2|nr:hypothetical protein [Bacillus sp. RO1]NLP52552.1 hypothetical protein [Bacillus sp. RO1]